MTLKTRLKKIEGRVKSIGENPMPIQVIVVDDEEEVKKKISELKQQYGEERYSKGTVLTIMRYQKRESGRILTL